MSHHWFMFPLTEMCRSTVCVYVTEKKKNDILSAMAMVSEHTCVSFHNQTSEINYLLFQSSKGYEDI